VKAWPCCFTLPFIIITERERERDMVVQMVFRILLLLGSINAIVQGAGVTNGSCSTQTKCGEVDIPYPFGIGADCYINDWFAIDCNETLSSTSPKPFLRRLNLEVLNISIQGTVRVNYPIFMTCDNGTKSTANVNVDLVSSPFVFSQSKTRFLAVGCNTFASLTSPDGSVIGGCMSVCDQTKKTILTNDTSCNGINCCQTTIPSDLNEFNATIKPIETQSAPDCKYAFLVEQTWFQTNMRNPSEIQYMSHVPVVLDWGINTTFFSLVTGNNMSTDSSTSWSSSTFFCNTSTNSTGNPRLTFTCSCKFGFQGNPYLPQRCTGKLFL
jgi:hypothetical protein